MMLANAEKWLSLQAGAEQEFERALADPEAAQAAKLRGYLERNAETAFGREHGFATLSGYGDYAEAVPVRCYPDIESWIARIADGENQVLTSEPVIGFEETSGSSRAKKWIPFTESLRAEFEDAVGVWLCDLARHCPQAFGGRAYWSISPPLKARGSANGGVPIGIGSDLGYFSAASAALLAPLMVVPPHADRTSDGDQFWAGTVEALLEATDLALISVWSPSFFLTLDRRLRDHLGRDSFVWSDLWPHLSMLSCWTDAQSAMWMPALRKRLGDVPVQGKGLLSTEGVVSVPLSARARSTDPVLALGAHFFEFRHRGEDRIVLAHQLETGRDYEVILTTGGGLYRYATGDLVRAGENLSLKFLGREGRHSDLVGEKLDEAQVIEALAGIDGARFIAARQGDRGAGYDLYLDVPQDSDRAVAQLETRLEENAYYKQAIDLGQLRPLEANILSAERLERLVEKLALQGNTRLGDVKLPALFRMGELEGLLDADAQP